MQIVFVLRTTRRAEHKKDATDALYCFFDTQARGEPSLSPLSKSCHMQNSKTLDVDTAPEKVNAIPFYFEIP